MLRRREGAIEIVRVSELFDDVSKRAGVITNSDITSHHRDDLLRFANPMSLICAALAEYIATGGQSRRFEVMIAEQPERLLSLHLIISTDRTVFDVDAPAFALPIPDLGELRDLSPDLAPLFHGPRLSIVSARTMLAERFGYDGVTFNLDYSLSFDSNMGDKVRAYVFGRPLDPDIKRRVIAFVRLVKQRHWRLDLAPFLAENRRHAGQPGNERPLDTLLAFRLLGHLDMAASLENPEAPKFAVAPMSLREQARRDLDQIMDANLVRRYERGQSGTYALLLKLAELWLSNRTQPQRTFRSLIDFCVFDLRCFIKLELELAWDFLQRPSIPFFGPLKGPSKNLARKVHGMAWDITHYRLLEWISARCAGREVFVPIFAALDRGLIDLMRAKPVQVQIVDASTESSESIYGGELDFRIAVDAHTSDEARARLIDPDRIARLKDTPQDDRVAQLVASLEPRVERLAEEVRRRSQVKD